MNVDRNFYRTHFVKALIAFLFLCSTLKAQEPTFLETETTSWNPRTPRTREATKGPSYIKPPEKKTVPKILTSHIQFGANYTYAHITPSNQSSTSGNLYGAQALYEYKTFNRFYGALATAWRQGVTHGANTSRSLLELDAQERLGYTWGSCRKGRMFSLFSGFGYRHNGENVKSSGSSVKFYYNEIYIPVGFLFNGDLNSIVSLGLNFQWMPQVYPTLKISPLNGARWILNNTLSNFRAELPLTISVSRKYHCALMLQPYFEYWQDGHTSARTQIGTTLHVPGNTYLFAGIDLNARFSF